MKLLMKFLHEIGSYGLAGGFAVQLIVLARRDPSDPMAQELIGDISSWLLVPSFFLMGASGVLAMVLRPVFIARTWVWLKILFTVPTFYALLATYPGVGELSERTPSQLWIALVASILVTVFSVWRRPKGPSLA